jgi:exonuclease SbcC
MLNWLFKRRGAAAAKPSAAPPPAAPTAASPPPTEDRRAQWQARLEAARGDDRQLLEVALGAPTLDLKLAAVEALTGEDALRTAEREFRRHDRRAHQRAKQRLDAAVSMRESRSRAEALIESATALAGEALVPLNRLAQLDRDWLALAAGQLEPGQAERFAAARGQLDAAMRERDARRQSEQRWIGEAQTALAELQRGLADAAARGQAGDVDALVRSAQELGARRPEGAPTAAAAEALQAWLHLAAQVQARLGVIADAAPDAGAVAPQAVASAAERWQALPALADATLAHVLDERMARALPAAPPAAAPVAGARRPPRPDRPKPPEAGLVARVDELLTQAEQVLAAGQLGQMPARLAAIDAAFEALGRAAPSDALSARRQALNAEFGRLRSWQQWGGARAVDTLVEEAEALERAAAAASEEAPLDLDRHAAAIRDLRARWKALERQRAPTGAAPWQRFDAALQAAYAPIAARHQAQDAERRDNLAARQALLDALDAVPAQVPAGEGLGEHWRTQIRTLERFRADWHALGPLEQRVPREARQALRRRLRQSLERVEAPLAQARAAAAQAREPLIQAAEALAREVSAREDRAGAADSPPPAGLRAGGGNGPAAPLRDAVARARALQDEWARRARELPLAHPVETALWSRFRAAVDTVFAQRQAAAQAAEAELGARVAAREALVGRLGALSPDMPGAELRRVLAEVDAAWRDAPELPRGAGAAIDAGYRSARDAVQGWLAGGAQRRWQAWCDTLASRLAQCEAREAGAAEPAAAGGEAGALPPRWEDALARRAIEPDGDAGLDPEAIAHRLLRLEAALALPSPPECADARRALKLHAMKDALEGRTAAPEAAQRTGWLLDLVGQRLADAGQRERLHAIVAGLRKAPPGTLELPSAAD